MTTEIAWTKTDAAYLEIRRRILDGTMVAGDVLDQGILAEQLGVSTTPVREALRRLEAERFVVMAAHRDARVAPLLISEVKHLYAVRLTLDPLAAEQAATAATDEELEAIVAILDEAVDSDDADLARNNRFHRAVYRACGNPILVDILDQLWDRSHRYRAVLEQVDPEVLREHDEHASIVDALLRRDGPAAADLVRRHLERSFREIQRVTATME